MDKDKSIDVLNSLITINNDRIEGYETASKATEEIELKTLFSQLSSTSQKCKEELETEVTKMGGEPAEGTKVSGKFFRTWMDVKAAITGKDRKAILDSCEYGEDAALKTYNDVLENDMNDISTAQQSIVRAQQTKLKSDHDNVKLLRDALKMHN